MKVRILRSFVGSVGKEKHRLQEGEVVEMPNEADWVRVGFAEEVRGEASADKRARKGAKAQSGG